MAVQSPVKNHVRIKRPWKWRFDIIIIIIIDDMNLHKNEVNPAEITAKAGERKKNTK